jgi:hypothetical protein
MNVASGFTIFCYLIPAWHTIRTRLLKGWQRRQLKPLMACARKVANPLAQNTLNNYEPFPKKRRTLAGKVMDDEKQCEAQRVFQDQKLQPLLDEAKQGKRRLLFVDAAHFVMGAFLGMVWCLTRLLLPSNASYQKCRSVADKAKEPGIELLYLPPLFSQPEFDRTIVAVCKKGDIV